MHQSLLELWDRGPEGRVASDAVVEAVDIIESHVGQRSARRGRSGICRPKDPARRTDSVDR